MSGADNNNLRVVVRCRPRVGKELEEGSDRSKDTLRIISDSEVDFINVRSDSDTCRFRFDGCYGAESAQKEIFGNEIKTMLNHVMVGRNASVLAYGHTGAGKTYTMQGTKQDPGIIPRTIKRIFNTVKANQSQSNFELEMSALEIYNEEVFDLLHVRSKSLPIRQDAEGVNHIKSLHKVKITNYSEFQNQFDKALKSRTTAPTLLNANSSRSHFFVIVNVTREIISKGKVYHGKVVLVDLAGSEDNRRTGNQGGRMKESGMINKSLLAFNSLVDQLSNNGFPNYRQSALTRLLKDSLGGNSHSCMFANIAQGNYHDTLNTLNFAKKGMEIVNKPFEKVQDIPAPKKVIIPKSFKQNKRTPLKTTLESSKGRGSLGKNSSLKTGGAQRVVNNNAERERKPLGSLGNRTNQRLISGGSSSSGIRGNARIRKVGSSSHSGLDKKKLTESVLNKRHQITAEERTGMARKYIDEADLHAINKEFESAIKSYQQALYFCVGTEEAHNIAKRIVNLEKKKASSEKKKQQLKMKELEAAVGGCNSSGSNANSNLQSTTSIVQNVFGDRLGLQNNKSSDKKVTGLFDRSSNSSKSMDGNKSVKAAFENHHTSNFAIYNDNSMSSCSVSNEKKGMDTVKVNVHGGIRRELEQKLLGFVNNTSITDLQKLKGIGKAHSKKLVESRLNKGMFMSLKDCQEKGGFSDKFFDNFVSNNLNRFVEISY